MRCVRFSRFVSFNVKLIVHSSQVAGPHRPIALATSAIVDRQWQTQLQSRAQAIANQGSRMGADLYNNLSNAMGERG